MILPHDCPLPGQEPELTRLLQLVEAEIERMRKRLEAELPPTRAPRASADLRGLSPRELESLRLHCHENLLQAIRLLLGWEADHRLDLAPPREPLLVAAAVQSALRRLHRDLGEPPDPAQEALFRWLLGVARRRRIFIPRHMRLADLADPRSWREHRERLRRLVSVPPRRVSPPRRPRRGKRARRPGSPPPPLPSPQVSWVRRNLAGRVVLLIGGECRSFAKERLERDLGLAELRWVSTRAHRSLDPLRCAIQRSEVVLVLCLVRWADHAFGELERCAREAGKPFVRIPGGYGTNAIAFEIRRQAGRRLEGGDRPKAG